MEPETLSLLIAWKRGEKGTALTYEGSDRRVKDVFGRDIPCQGGWSATVITQYSAAISVNATATGNGGAYSSRCEECWSEFKVLNEEGKRNYNGCLHGHLGKPELWAKGNPITSTMFKNSQTRSTRMDGATNMTTKGNAPIDIFELFDVRGIYNLFPHFFISLICHRGTLFIKLPIRLHDLGYDSTVSQTVSPL